jgi:broad specificity phosphatase PhoE
MTTFLLIRHGETDAVGKTISGWAPGWHLNEHGRQQVTKLGERLAGVPIKALYVSPLERAIETADAIAAKHGLTPQRSDGLGEIRFGEWESVSFADLELRQEWKNFNAFRSGNRIPGGEQMVDVQQRMVRELDRLRHLHPEDTVAVVSHGDPIRLVLSHYLGIPVDLMTRFEITPSSVSVLEIADWGSRVRCLNHLGESPL